MLDPRTRKRKRRRRQKIHQNQVDMQFNWFLALISIGLWAGLIFIFLYVEPSLIRDIPVPGWYAPLFLLLFITLLSTTRLLSGNRKRAITLSVLITVFLILRINQLGQWYNGLLIVILGLAIEYFWISQFKFKWWQKLTNRQDVVKSQE